MSLDLIDDNCNGRIKATLGFWTRPNYKDLLAFLTKRMKKDASKDLHLNRGRTFLAIGNSKSARYDFDEYLKIDQNNPRAFTNRAATRFPDDMNGVITDCNKAIALNPKEKNAYFMLGLAQYELGQIESACESFAKAIDLGFSILRIAESSKCSDYWENN